MTLAWHPLTLNHTPYLVSFAIENEGYRLVLTDVNHVWEATLARDAFKKVKQVGLLFNGHFGFFALTGHKETMPQLATEEQELLQILKQKLYWTEGEPPANQTASETQPQYTLQLSSNNKKALLTLKSKIGFFPFSWTFHASLLPDASIFVKDNFVLPLLFAQLALNRRLTRLKQIVADKDKQLQEYQKSGVKIPKGEFWNGDLLFESINGDLVDQ